MDMVYIKEPPSLRDRKIKRNSVFLNKFRKNSEEKKEKEPNNMALSSTFDKLDKRKFMQKVKNTTYKMIRYNLNFETACQHNWNSTAPYNNPVSYVILRFALKGKFHKCFDFLKENFTLIFDID